jgi:hypothetical protein
MGKEGTMLKKRTASMVKGKNVTTASNPTRFDKEKQKILYLLKIKFKTQKRGAGRGAWKEGREQGQGEW